MKKILKTRQYQDDIVDIYKESIRRFGLTTARETMRQIEEAEKNIANGTISGILDPDFHSSRFHYNFIRNRQKLFFEMFDDEIVLVMAGYDSRNWKKILDEQENFIEEQIAQAKKRMKD